ncbi:hypothetical protein SKAU_G00290030 [Synaphobranchus kaupii]|uniref:Uncharacterized protein n=1 Tax=Synaphobranchus kaupii TaxID=118154 RepID=A0A9Q1ETM0_SYNKA|nr:hypothetical protein SKAU_G00290030 [Synaphobranchus kaupii]
MKSQTGPRGARVLKASHSSRKGSKFGGVVRGDMPQRLWRVLTAVTRQPVNLRDFTRHPRALVPPLDGVAKRKPILTSAVKLRLQNPGGEEVVMIMAPGFISCFWGVSVKAPHPS